ncbi:MAG: deoxyhypusine synthase [Candidatus Diapherotrites archaeon]|nr:deoxyhypusine synthase [Candidatus Diapherotrites archaeon]
MQKIVDFDSDAFSAKGISGVFANSGFQATNIAGAVELIEKMKKDKATIILSFTANMVATGMRGIIAELCRKKFVDAIITTAGSTDHDIIKSFVPYSVGSFDADDSELHAKGINRIGNIFVPTKGFEVLEQKIRPVYKKMLEGKKPFSPSELNSEIGGILGKDSFLYWCRKNSIPVFCPGITDGAIGLQMYFFRQDNPGFIVDVTKDMKELADIVLNADKTGAIILGGGISKHHTIGVNILREGLDYAVYVSTAGEFDGSLSGARPKEAKSWGKLKEKGSSVHVFCEATIAVPLIVASLKEKGLL